MKSEDQVTLLDSTRWDSPVTDMVLVLTLLRSATISASLAWICVIMWCFLLLAGVDGQRDLLNADEGYNDYYNDVSDEEQEQSSYPQRAALNEGISICLYIA